MSQITKEKAIAVLSDLLDECLSSMNQEGSWEVVSIDTEKETFVVKFNYFVLEEDNYIALAGY